MGVAADVVIYPGSLLVVDIHQGDESTARRILGRDYRITFGVFVRETVEESLRIHSSRKNCATEREPSEVSRL